MKLSPTESWSSNEPFGGDRRVTAGGTKSHVLEHPLCAVSFHPPGLSHAFAVPDEDDQFAEYKSAVLKQITFWEMLETELNEFIPTELFRNEELEMEDSGLLSRKMPCALPEMFECETVVFEFLE